MNTKSSKSLIALGSIIAGLLIYETSRKSRKSPQIKKIKEWIDWEIALKKDTNDSEKVKIVNAIEKHIIDHLYSQNLGNATVKSIEFTYSDNGYRHFRLKVTVQFGLRFKDAVIVYPPRPHPPSTEVLKLISFLVENVKDIGTNTKFNTEGSNQDF